MNLTNFLSFFSQKNVRKISGIRVPYKKHTSCMDVLMSKGWKDATYQNRTNPKQLAKLLWWPRKGCKFPKITLKRKIPNLEKGKGMFFLMKNYYDKIYIWFNFYMTFPLILFLIYLF